LVEADVSLNSWPDGAMTPFRSEKNTNWEGAFRVPCMIRWPGHIAAGQVCNEIVSGHDWLPTLMAAVGDPDVKDKLLKGYIQGPYRRLQPASIPDRPGAEESAQGFLLLQ
jgi:arylsulfatase A-like enzyme